MSKKLQGKKQERQQQLSFFGKDLVRRCGARCELCAAGSVSLSVYEVGPIPKEAQYEHCIMICEVCLDSLSQPKRAQVDHWRCLMSTMWSEVIAAKITAIVVLKYLADKHTWAQECLEQAMLDEQEQEWVDSWRL